MKKVITFNLWGDNPKYTIGAIENAKIANQLFSDWECRFYTNQVPNDIIAKLDKTATIVQMASGPWKKYGRRAGDAQPINSMFWKIETFFHPDIDAFISRDVDSRLSYREKIALDEWIQSDKEFHIIRDHPADVAHTPILGSMWGIKTSISLDMAALIKDYKENNVKWVDQFFLRDYIYPRIKDYALIHHDESCAAGCQAKKDSPLYWEDGNTEHRMLAPRDWFRFSECIGIDYNQDNTMIEQSLNWLKLWYKTGEYWWKK
jgi:hypothetical protein